LADNGLIKTRDAGENNILFSGLFTPKIIALKVLNSAI